MIHEKAAELFFQRLCGDLTQGLAAGVGSQIGSLYNHIATQEDLLVQVMGGAIDGLAQDRAREVFIGNFDLIALSDDVRETTTVKRNTYEGNARHLIEEAVKAGLASIVGMGGHIASWYLPGGLLCLDGIAENYAMFALRELRVVDADGRVKGAGERRHA